MAKTYPQDAAPDTGERESGELEQSPLRVYLRDMGTVAVLTRHEEVALAQQIERGERAVLTAVLRSPIALDELLRLAAGLRHGGVRAKDIVREAEEAGDAFDEEKAVQRILRLVGKIGRLQAKLEQQRRLRAKSRAAEGTAITSPKRPKRLRERWHFAPADSRSAPRPMN